MYKTSQRLEEVEPFARELREAPDFFCSLLGDPEGDQITGNEIRVKQEKIKMLQQ